MQFAVPKIYPITDARLSGLSHFEQVERLIAGGASLIQLREKHAPSRFFFEDAHAAVILARKHGVKIIINDRSDLALALAADGVHLGQDDLPSAMARTMLGSDAMIGLSTHTIEQARAAMDEPVDYIAFGPIFATVSKDNPDPVTGLDSLARVRREIGDFPLVAIGGITISNVECVFAAGANSAAVVSSILRDPKEISTRMAEFRLHASD
ncbi:MAG: thiamine phosphate synthase [Acidobacteria bacterium]|nr:thiamine phosphate synthase [Acidobacteriota bacterium]